jgi:mRNA-degrading endonuclease RelE of RelBE toxin-antitoxin system
LNWTVIETKQAAKQLLKLPKKIGLIYRELVDDFGRCGPWPKGWDIRPLKGEMILRAKLTREYRVIFEIVKPKIVVLKVAHRKEAYK